MVNENRIVEDFLGLVQIDSVSGQEGNLRDYLSSRLESLGLTVYEDGAGKVLKGESGNLIAWLDGNIPAPPVMFCAHMDTVVPGVGVKPVVAEGLVRSSGDTILGGDDKAGIAGILEALQVIREQELGHPPVEVVFTVSEEVGLMGSKHLEFERIRSKLGYVLDADGKIGDIVIEGPSQNEFEIRVQGKAAHAGINPEEGVNAIVCAAHAIDSMTVGRIDEETTCNIGTIQGGRARNIVADDCLVYGEARSHSPAKLEKVTNHIVNTFKEKVATKGGRCSARVTHLYGEINLDKDEPVVQIAVQAAEALGKEAVLTRTGGGSDANILNQRGIRCANLGIGMKKVHTVEEYIAVKDLVDNARYILKIIEVAGQIKA
ncbi:MAG: M20/M25/M40 family metallo-hydrolase [Syntrophomonadaceae bacterium]|nr:M20/M25/M40 family metallo-hydrolase [Syntrophomonadaceae bacterium]